MMTRNLKVSLLIASTLVVLGDDVVAGVLFPPPGLPAHPELLPIGVRLRKPHGLLLFWPGRLRHDRRRLLWRRNGRLSRWVRLRPARLPGTTSAGPATTRAASAGRRPGSGCGPAWASAASDRGADRSTGCAITLRGAPAETYGLTRGSVGQMRMPRPVTARPAAGEKIRTAIEAAGRHSGGDPAICSGRSNERARTQRCRHQAPSAGKSPSPTDASRGVTAARPFRVSSTQLGHVPPKVLQALGPSE